MPFVNMDEMLRKATRERYAVGNFDSFNLELLHGVLRTAQKNNSPAIIAYAPVFGEFISAHEMSALVQAAVAKLTIPVALHLDHAGSMEEIIEALDAGFTSVMIDASAKSLAENIAITKEVKRVCEKYGATVEAELGHVGGLEGQYEADEGDEVSYTDVAEARQFVDQTGVDALAVAIGTVHGVYSTEPKLNLERLKELRAAVDIPLVLHGASGLSDDDLRACIAGGVSKINIFTDMTVAAMDYIHNSGEENVYLSECMQITEEIGKVVQTKIDIFGSANRA